MSEINKPKIIPVTFDDVVIKFSLCGRYYIGFIFMIMLLYIHDNVSSASYVFVTKEVKYWCADGRFGNDSCANMSNSTEQCAEWVYDDPTSFVAQFQLACQEWKRTLVGTMQGFGHGVGLLLIGPLSDRLGRKTVTVGTAGVSVFAGVAKSFSNNYWMFIFLEFLGSVGEVYSSTYVLAVEMVAHDKRVLTQMICYTGQVIGYVLLPLTAWLFQYWRHFLLFLYGPAIIFIFYTFLLDESPRWLLTKGRKEKAIAILQKTARSCKTKLDKDDLENLTCEKNEQASFTKSIKDTFTSLVLMKRFFMCLIWWSSCIFVNYGLKVYTVSLPGNKYTNYGLMGISALPSMFLTYYLLRKFSRKVSMLITFLLCAVVSISQPFIPETSQWASILLIMAGKLLMTTNVSVIYVFTSELFPTYTRNSTLALCSAVGRIGSILGPQTPLLMVYWHGLPSLLFGAVSLLAGVVTLFAPDTSDEALPDNVRQAEDVGHRQPANIGIDNRGFSLETTEF